MKNSEPSERSQEMTTRTVYAVGGNMRRRGGRQLPPVFICRG